MFTHVDHGIELPQISRKNVDGTRKYFTPTGEAYPSVTTVLGILGKKELMEWRKRVGEEEANKISRQAANRGTAVHKLCEDYLDNKEDYSKKHMPANIHMFNTMKPLLDQKINNLWFQESFLYSNDLKTGGQVDCIAEFEGELSVIDFKTSRRPKKADGILSYFMQVSFYAKAFEEMTGTPIRKGIVLIGVDDSEPQTFVINPDDYIEHFKAVRETYSKLYEKDALYNS
jgi:genome maintenance exonuclease 1